MLLSASTTLSLATTTVVPPSWLALSIRPCRSSAGRDNRSPAYEIRKNNLGAPLGAPKTLRTVNSLRLHPPQSRHHLRQIVVHDDSSNQDQHDECELINALLHAQTDVAAHDGFDKEHE